MFLPEGVSFKLIRQDVELQTVLLVHSSNEVTLEISLGQVSMLDLYQVMDATDTQFPQKHSDLLDNVSQVTTTNKRFLLHNYGPIESPHILRDAGKKVKYKINGQGTLMVLRGDGSYMGIKCWYTPSLPVTVISRGEHFQQNPSKLESHTIFSHEFKGTGEVCFNTTLVSSDDIFLSQCF